jgi:hypothetical protein
LCSFLIIKVTNIKDGIKEGEGSRGLEQNCNFPESEMFASEKP